ncbi:MAG: 23S rRNA (guanosine(2251)-2'-O)-methyltransferase RlmB [Bacteroidia bacterium]|nr:MAG: 23S rRNA (guanosine(2251)-2'-O)-methyltransferase RlmB [Bacteroidia bacterium]
MERADYIFGSRAVLEALGTERVLEKVLICRSPDNDLQNLLIKELKRHKVFFQFVPMQKLRRISGKNHQGVIAFVSPIAFGDVQEIVTSTFESGKVPFILVADGVTDVRNFGALVRSAECAGVDAVLVPEKNSAGINADAVKTSAGALHKVPICRTPSLRKTLIDLKNSGLQAVAGSEKAARNYYEVNFRKPTALIVGDEQKGISKSLHTLADFFVKIPLLGEIKSLNVSVAASILLYEKVRQDFVAD